MSEPVPKPEAKPSAAEARRQRLAQALRDNLRRRKAAKDPAPAADKDD